MRSHYSYDFKLYGDWAASTRTAFVALVNGANPAALIASLRHSFDLKGIAEVDVEVKPWDAHGVPKAWIGRIRVAGPRFDVGDTF